jgi:hypothetical protein
MVPPTGKVQCTGCGKLVNDGRGYANHKRTCKRQQGEAAVRLDLRHQNLEKRAQAEHEELQRLAEYEELSVTGDGYAFGAGGDDVVEPMEVCICSITVMNAEFFCAG